ncbi:MAG: hypothetical protein LQ341_001747, partial [Variospora aurantia]
MTNMASAITVELFPKPALLIPTSTEFFAQTSHYSMDISQSSAELLADSTILAALPTENIEILRHGSNKQYLDTLAHFALQPSHTSAIFTSHNQLSVEFSSIWLTSDTKTVAIFAALARILPVAPYLSPYITRLMQKHTDGPLTFLASPNVIAILDLPQNGLQDILLAIFRLLEFDNAAFAHFISPAQLQMLLSHTCRPVRYLAIRILCHYLHASEAALHAMVEKYLGDGKIDGKWEGKSIDYMFLSLWEDKRLKDLKSDLDDAIAKRSSARPPPGARRTISQGDFSNTTACVAGVLLPRLNPGSAIGSSLVMTPTVEANLHSLAGAMTTDRPILLTGPLGAGKTSLVKEVANLLGREEDMLVLHLNEQTDAKLLIGMYTTSGGPGSFSWQPGILTKAVSEGKWVLIEDYDRAPAEIVSMILPVLERRELLVPHWGQAIRASAGFKIIATIRSSENRSGEQIMTRRTMIGARHWEQVHLRPLPVDELGEIMVQRYPIIHAYRPRMLCLYSRFEGKPGHRPYRDDFRARSHSPQDLLRWGSRIDHLLRGVKLTSGHEPISEATEEKIFLEAVDCFAGDLPEGTVKEQVVNVIAQELHISRERLSFCLKVRKPEYAQDQTILRIGRASLTRKGSRGSQVHKMKSQRSTFAPTSLVLRHLESVGVAIVMGEPCLLVGETGTGKTTLVQELAESLGKKLEVINLSQQSEAGDLLGGFKPVNIRSLAIPLKEDFEDLFESTFSSKKNQRYTEHVAKAIAKNRWSRALSLWRDAAHLVESTFLAQMTKSKMVTEEPLLKKRKVQSQKLQMLRDRWEQFKKNLNTFYKHLESGSKGFAFSFAEGNIVKAARNGDWVLLDEINLAAPDTLDSLADLLTHGNDGGPSILLTETGETERIQAHPDFRIFGAMNPANDVGKRDLPLSLRSRFTELFIDAPDKDLSNLTPLIQAYLGNNSYKDVRIASDVAQLYLDIQKLAHENRLVDGSDQKPHYSLRTLTRTLIYVGDIAPIYGLRRALYEGFSMSFLTHLNHASSQLVIPLMDKHLLGNPKNVQALLLQSPRAPQHIEKVVKFKQYWMWKGPLPVQEQAHYIVTPFIERNLLNLVRATSTRKFPVLLQGPTSSGKTSMVEYLANISGHKFVRINNHEHTDLQEYLGTYVSGPDGQLQYQEGILVQALREGFWIVLDELNLAPTDVLEALNRLLDDNRELFLPETQQIVRPHENFILFATQNPPGLYGGRKVLSRAFRNRFLELHFDDIPEDELEVILRERSQIAPSFCSRIVAVYKKLSLRRQHSRLFEQKSSFATLRDLFRWASRDAGDREQLARNGYYLLAERVRNDEERLVVKSTIEEVMRTTIDDAAMYGPQVIPAHAGLSSTFHGVVWTQSMRRLYVLVTEALKNQEPVLLVGETGSGKTTICQVVAAAMQNYLHIVNAHQSMETGDLIGSQRPVRSRQSVEARLKAELCTVLPNSLGTEQLSRSTLDQLAAAYRALPRLTRETIPLQTRRGLDEDLARFHALFEWVDGSLVNAMKAGQHFLLDEISLADDSVLERLNSVLEPARRLFLAEKGVNDALVVAAEGFQFLATMNPGGDYGKKELSPALRNRFTEIWVPQASTQHELEEILKSKLGQSKVHLAKPMVAFARWHGTNFSNTAPEISIRDLLAWVTFLNTGCIIDLHLSILHGAALVYIDTLGANPSAKLHAGTTAIDAQRQRCLDRLSELFDFDMTVLYEEIPRLVSEDGRIIVGPFSLKRYAGALPDLGYNFHAPTTLKNTLKITRALQLPRPILMEGSPGVGKTTLVAALAQACGMPLTRINLSDQTDLMDLFGSDVPVEGGTAGQFQWQDAPFLRAMQKGEWVLLDEMNLASQSVLEGLNACFDHRGQVYVSELDQTFHRHQNFVVFAAQNPHHQGSGRKGLPASFVNRFTIVYADIFKAEDLLTICGNKFPSLAPDTIKLLTQCVTGLEAAVQPSRRLGMNGGPWEINLRDTIRWLDLSSSPDGLLRGAGIGDFAAMLFLQRFRTTEDASTIASLLKQHLPYIDASRHRVFCSSDNFVQLGLGLLSRQAVSLSSGCKHRVLPNSHLPYVESILLCIARCWPCLLVGPSGSGKTEMVRYLASCIGAELIEFSMNSEMDTTDLVGGYEQLDTQRERAAFVTRLRAFLKKIRLQQVLSAGKQHGLLAELEARLSVTTPDIADAVKLIRKIADQEVDEGFGSYLPECEAIIQKGSPDRRARFEWVDGILVRAIIEGRWLILSNANLCSPSVLDRLNSLLEPNGVLNINERRSESGSVRVVKPHPNFRLFMTMDPQHGELSRAMRNRNIELFVPKEEHPYVHDGIDLTLDSAMSRFALCQKIFSSTLRGLDIDNIVWICLDHLTFSDHDLLGGWLEQIAAGLVGVSSEISRSFSFIARRFTSFIFSPGEGILQSIRNMYLKLTRQLNLPFGFENVQPIQPLNNSILPNLELQALGSNELRRFGLSLDLLIDVVRLELRLQSIVDSTSSQIPMPLSRLQKSITSATSRRFNEESTKPLAQFLAETLRILRSTIERTDNLEHDVDLAYSCRQLQLSSIKSLTSCLSFLRDLIDIAHAAEFEEAAFQVYLCLGRKILSELSPTAATEDLIQSMHRGFDSFTQFRKLRSGQSMDLIWSRVKPPVPATSQQLEHIMRVEQLAERFDALLWTSDVPLEKIGDTRQMITQIGQITDTHSEGSIETVQGITDALRALEAKKEPFAETRQPYMQPEFEALRQYQTMSPVTLTNNARGLLDLLSGRATNELLGSTEPSRGWQLFSKINLATGIGGKDNTFLPIRSIFPISVLEKMASISDVPLNSLDLLQAEVLQMTSHTARLTVVIDSDQDSMLLDLLKQLHLELASAHKNCLQPWQHGEDSDPSSLLTLWRMSEELPPSHHLHNIIQNYFQPSCELSAKGDEGHLIWDTASAWILFFAGCLKIYVPDQVHDPALKPRIIRDRHRRRIAELHGKLSALRHYEEITTGQSTNLRCQLVQEELEAWGQEPAVEPILRPIASELGQLQGEFRSILQSVVERSPDQDRLALLLSGDAFMDQEVELLRSNITQAISRLHGSYRMYEDMTRPLMAMLNGLDAGLAMAQIVIAPAQAAAGSIQHICSYTPFFGMRPGILAEENIESIGQASSECRWKYLESAAVMNCITTSSRAVTLSNIFRIVHNIYEDWKKQLSEAQKRDFAKTSMYRYRGGEADAAANDEEEFNELFPDYERVGARATESSNPHLNPRELAQRLARYQRDLFDSRANSVDRVLQLMKSSCANMGQLWQHHRNSMSPLPAQNFLCGLMLELDENMNRLHHVSPSSEPCNFYTDANLPEARKLLSLLRRIQGRFYEVKQAWPDHATLDDVLRTSCDLLVFRHTEPVAKLITKVEKLHGFVHEWQLVASREYSASALYEQLTSLIVDWRRLELATWSRLFDMEDQRCRDEVDSWWFVAYEAIVAAPLSILEAGNNLQEHTEELFETLQGFVINSAAGHFALRLGLIEAFSKYVSLIERSVPGFKIIHNTLSNFLALYNRYTSPIQQMLQTGRLKLEKEMKDVLLLASWKDTNVNALRESARRSHHKLFKVVRKYRTLLARPAQSVIDQGFPAYLQPNPTSSASIQTRSLQPETDPLQVLQGLSYEWSERAPRFRNIWATVSNMTSMSQMHASANEVPSLLNHFTTGLSDDIRILRKETPPTATDENVDIFKHLTSRKRKLFSETLKSVRQMGFRTNLSVDVLSRQASTSLILSRIVPINQTARSDKVGASEYHLHRLLDLMPVVRQALQTHSEDLSGSEVARSVGYVESMLSHVIRQRTLLGQFAASLDGLDQTVQTVENVWKPSSYQIMPENLADEVDERVKRCILQLPCIIDVGCIVIEKHGKLGNFDHSDICGRLREWSVKLKAAASDLESEPILPRRLTYSGQRAKYAQAQKLVEAFSEDLKRDVTSHPDLAFALRQIALWTETPPAIVNGSYSHESSLSAIDFDQALLKSCDAVLVTIQTLERTVSAITSTEHASWLIKSGNALADGFRALHVEEICDSLESTMDMLHRLRQEDLMVASLLTAIVLPIINQYRSICHDFFDHAAAQTNSLNNLAATLAKHFTQIATQGFCSPSKPGAAEAGKNEKLEEGTGLGEGEGAEDISKDVQDDEDLSELALEGQKSKEGEEISDQEDAVNMDEDELEGEMGDAPEKDAEGDEASLEAASEDGDLDEETGDVDNLDPNAVDEKLWDDDDQKQTEKEKVGGKAKGAGEKDDQPNADSDQKDAEEGAAEEEENLSDAGAEENEEVAKGEAEQMDPHTQQGENLDLPDEMDLDGQEKSSVGSDVEDDDLDGLSHADSDQGQRPDEAISDKKLDDDEDSREEQATQNEQTAAEAETSDADQADDIGSPVDTEPEPDSDADEGLLQNRTDNATIDEKNVAPSDAQGLEGQDADETADTQMQENKSAGNSGVASDGVNAERAQAPAAEGELSNLQDKSRDPAEGPGQKIEDTTNQAFKKLGDALEAWHRQQRQIQAARSSPDSEQDVPDMDVIDPEFQHLEKDDAEADTQALGAATEDQAHTLDQRAFDVEMQDQPQDFIPDEAQAEQNQDKEDTVMEEVGFSELDKVDREDEAAKSHTFIGQPTAYRPIDDPHSKPQTEDMDDSPSSNDPVASPASTHPSSSPLPRSFASASALWSHHSATTRPLSLLLTEQLRLLLAPTLATKLRGDFRTGKRLNIKRIIPYIASSYRRDKIWLRRSAPSKRAYHVLLAVDDSRSMAEAGRGELAFETLALVANSLHMLEAGEISIVGFGEHVVIAHPFGAPWSADAGVDVFRHFGFRQRRTDVRKLLEKSLDLFRAAKRASSSSNNGGEEVWQLQFIISDGVVCEDHDSIRRLVRRAVEERVMVVFVIVDTVAAAAAAAEDGGGGSSSSIVDMNEA